MRKIERELHKEFPGAAITVTGRSHYRIELPNGRSLFTAGTPSDRRALENRRRTARKLLNQDKQR